MDKLFKDIVITYIPRYIKCALTEENVLSTNITEHGRKHCFLTKSRFVTIISNIIEGGPDGGPYALTKVKVLLINVTESFTYLEVSTMHSQMAQHNRNNGFEN